MLISMLYHCWSNVAHAPSKVKDAPKASPLFSSLSLHGLAVMGTLVRAASRLVSTLACASVSASQTSQHAVQQQRGIRHDASATESLPPFLTCAFQFSRPAICMT